MVTAPRATVVRADPALVAALEKLAEPRSDPALVAALQEIAKPKPIDPTLAQLLQSHQQALQHQHEQIKLLTIRIDGQEARYASGAADATKSRHDFRREVQDSQAEQLRAIEKLALKVDTKFEQIDTKLDKKSDELDSRIDAAGSATNAWVIRGLLGLVAILLGLVGWAVPSMFP